MNLLSKIINRIDQPPGSVFSHRESFAFADEELSRELLTFGQADDATTISTAESWFSKTAHEKHLEWLSNHQRWLRTKSSLSNGSIIYQRMTLVIK